GKDEEVEVAEVEEAEIKKPAPQSRDRSRPERSSRPDRGSRDERAGGNGGRSSSSSSGGGGTGGRERAGGGSRSPRHQPTITDLLREGQEVLVQIAKEPIAKKGARITSHIALPGRFLVYMPTVEQCAR